MLVRSLRGRPSLPLSYRYASSQSQALDRLLLDIHAAHKADQKRATNTDHDDNDWDQDLRGMGVERIQKSSEAKRGESLRGDVVLPRELTNAVNTIVEAIEDKSILRNNALSLYSHLRKTAQILPPPSSYRERQLLSTTYEDGDVTLAYLAGLMPNVYAATFNVLTILKQRLELLDNQEGAGEKDRWEPDRMVEFGSGTGSAAWAFETVFGPAGTRGGGGEEMVAREYVGLDTSREMVQVSSALFGSLPLRRIDNEEEQGDKKEEPSSTRLNAKSFQMSVPTTEQSMAKLHLTKKSFKEKRTIGMVAFTLGEMATREKRKEVVRSLWDSGAEIMVIIDRGTPAGSRIVIEAREQLIMYGKREVSRAVAKEIDEDLAKEGLEIVVDPEIAAQVEVDPSLGSHVIAPCPHDKACPLHHATKTYCHFSQRVQTPSFLRSTKHSSRGEDDSKFSYVVVRRGQRSKNTSASSSTSSFDELMSELDSQQNTTTAMKINEGHQREGQKEAGEGSSTTASELEWPRMIGPPLKRSGHVILEVCAASGDIERHTIPKSQGRQVYYDARKSAWGDTFPHRPKNGPQPSPSTTASPTLLSTSAVEDHKTGKLRNKFGGSLKGRSNKAAREFGKREARGLRDVEVGRTGRKWKREEAKARKRGMYWDDLAGGGGGDGSGVKEYEIDFEGGGGGDRKD